MYGDTHEYDPRPIERAHSDEYTFYSSINTQGGYARESGVVREANPYERWSDEWICWNSGWLECDEFKRGQDDPLYQEMLQKEEEEKEQKIAASGLKPLRDHAIECIKSFAAMKVSGRFSQWSLDTSRAVCHEAIERIFDWRKL